MTPLRVFHGITPNRLGHGPLHGPNQNARTLAWSSQPQTGPRNVENDPNLTFYFRAAIEKKTQAPAGITSVGTSPTPSASIFHTPSPSPTFRSYVPEQIHAHHVIPHAHAQTQLQAQLAGHQQYQMMQINNNINNPKGYQLFDTPTHNYFMSSNSTPSQTPTHAFNPNQNTFQIIQAHNLPKNQIILINPTGQTNPSHMTHGHVTHVQPTQIPGGVPPAHHRGVFTS